MDAALENKLFFVRELRSFMVYILLLGRSVPLAIFSSSLRKPWEEMPKKYGLKRMRKGIIPSVAKQAKRGVLARKKRDETGLNGQEEDKQR